ncbi:hypothetical protein [Deinococcus sp. UYEF24]
MTPYPDEYRLLAALVAEPLHTMAALKKAGLTFTGQREPTDAQRSLLCRIQPTEQTIRVVHWAGGGYMMTGIGESRLSTLERLYGPVREEK